MNSSGQHPLVTLNSLRVKLLHSLQNPIPPLHHHPSPFSLCWDLLPYLPPPAPVTGASLLFLSLTKHSDASGPLHLLLPLPKSPLSPDICMASCLLSIRFLINSLFSVSVYPPTLSKIANSFLSSFIALFFSVVVVTL